MIFFQKEAESRERTTNFTWSVQQPDKEKQWETSYVEKRIPEKKEILHSLVSHLQGAYSMEEIFIDLRL